MAFRYRPVLPLLLLALTAAALSAQPTEEARDLPPFDPTIAERPPMGWNSWDCLGWTATEAQVRAAGDYMAEHLSDLGYEYVVIDQGWFADSAASSFEAFVHDEIAEKPQYNIDAYGRLQPDTIKFPSAKGGKGFRPLADYLHGKGLKFGVHLLRGIPWMAADLDLPIYGTPYSGADIGQPTQGCDWYDGFYGVDMTKAGSQEYYNSVFRQFAEWGVDYVKADDMVNEAEFLAMSRAARASGRDIVFSVVPANIPWETLKENAHMARTGHDYWDVWQMLKQAFADANRYSDYRGEGFWPDLDMLPVGKLGIGISYKGPEARISNFTEDELHSLLSLWYISRNALMIGGYLPETDSLTLSLLQNKAAVEVNQYSTNNRQIHYMNAKVMWAADDVRNDDKYVAMFNIWETFRPVELTVNYYQLGLAEDRQFRVTELWTGEDLGVHAGTFTYPVVTHGAGLFRISPLAR